MSTRKQTQIILSIFILMISFSCSKDSFLGEGTSPLGYQKSSNPTKMTGMLKSSSKSIDPSDPGLVAYWKMDEAGGYILYDATGNQNFCSNSGATWTAGIINTGLDFNGINDYTRTFYPYSSLNITESITIEAWIKTPGNSGNQLIVQRCNDWPSVNKGYSFMLGADGRLAFSFGVNNFQYSSYGKYVNDNQWHHIAVVADHNTQQGKFYIDGAEWGTFTYTGIYNNPSDLLYMASWEGSAQLYKGLMDEVAIYNRVLSSTEIEDHYSPPTSSYGANWHMDEGSGLVINDSINDNDGTLYFELGWISGKSGSALNFDGVNDYVSCGYNTSLNITDDITIEAWIKTPGNVGNQAVLQKSSDWPSVNKGYTFLIGQDGRLIFSFGANNFQYSSYGKYVNDNLWHHIAVTANKSTGVGTFYIDGQAQGTFTYTGIYEAPFETLYLGAWEAKENYFKGIMDEMVIYDEELSASEILQHYNDLN